VGHQQGLGLALERSRLRYSSTNTATFDFRISSLNGLKM
jgi:hypothetical protein